MHERIEGPPRPAPLDLKSQGLLGSNLHLFEGSTEVQGKVRHLSLFVLRTPDNHKFAFYRKAAKELQETSPINTMKNRLRRLESDLAQCNSKLGG